MRFTKSLLIAAVTVVTPFIGHADPVNSSTAFSVDSYSFNDFSCQTVKGGLAVGGCKTIGVSSLTQPVAGIQFNTAQTALGYGFDDAVVDYHVHSSGSLISNVGLDFNGTFFGLAISSVTETIKNDAGTIVGFADVSCSLAGCSRQDNIALNGSYNDLFVTKDINVTALAGVAQISYVDQTFDGPATPEPSSFMLLGTALVGVGGLLRRRSKAAVKA